MRRFSIAVVCGLFLFGSTLCASAQQQAPTQKPTQAPTQKVSPVQKPTQKPTQTATQKPTQKPCQSPVQKKGGLASADRPERQGLLARLR
jgi:glucose/arabinose dehydrogenase